MRMVQIVVTQRFSTEITSTICMMGICIIQKAAG